MPADPQEQVAALHEHLEATGELPVERTANRWLGEATAVAADATTPGLDQEVRLRRVRQVRELLEHVTETGSTDADRHVERALAICEDLLDKP